MIVLIGSIRADRLLDQPEGEIEVDRYGVASGSEVYLCQWKDSLRLTNALRTHPDFPWITKVRARIRREEGDIARCVVFFEGVASSGTNSGQGEDTIIYELDNTTTQEPIETHPRYATVTDDDRRKIEEALKTRKAPVALSGALATELYQKKLKGTVSYLSPSVTWKQTITAATAKLNELDLNKIGDIDGPPGPVPQIAAGRNWLRSGSVETIRGSAAQIVNTWRLSGRAGWDANLYTS